MGERGLTMSKSNKYIVTDGSSLYRMDKETLKQHILRYFKICARKFNIELPDNTTLAVAYKIINEAERATHLISKEDEKLWLILDVMLEDNCPPWYINTIIRIYDDDCVNITGKVLDEILS